MSWLYLPPAVLPKPRTRACTDFPSVPEPVELISGSPSPVPGIALFVTSSGRPMRRPPSWRGWKTRPWIARLSGTTLPPLMATRGVERWISSLVDTRASRSRSRASARARLIPDICGPISRGSSLNANPNGCFWKTSPIISTSVIARSEASWKAWATGLRKASLRRQKLAHRINVNGCSSLPDGEHVNWPTPRASANENRQTKPTPSQLAGKHGMNLATKAAMWPTPMASDGCKPSAGNRKSADLTHASQMWPTPQTDGFRTRGGARRSEKGLDRMARDWPTPAARDAKGANSREHVEVNGTGRRHMDQLANFAVHSRQALTISGDGSNTCDQRRVLNPAFVEALMGWPIAWTGFDSVATGWSLWLQRMRFEFCRLGSLSMDREVTP